MAYTNVSPHSQMSTQEWKQWGQLALGVVQIAEDGLLDVNYTSVKLMEGGGGGENSSQNFGLNN